MTTSTVTQGREALKIQRQRLYQRCRRRGITHDKIAARAKCDRTTVVKYFSGDILGRALVGMRVTSTIHDLIREADAQSAA